MRTLLAAATVAVFLGAGAAHAERRLFIIPGNADGYGIDRCLVSGANCGKAAASAYCRSRQFSTAKSFRKVDRGEITGGVSATGPAPGGNADFVAIECTR
jgi:hypothetical protein